MDTVKAASGGLDGRVQRYGAGPTVPRMVLGARLRGLRESAGLTRQQAGAVIRGSDSKISRLELGRTGFKVRDLTDLLAGYGVADEAERATVLALADQANEPGWWQPYSDVIPGWFELYLGLEQAAGVIRNYEVQFVPGLLQTPDYARAVILLGHAHATADEIERRVALRIRRQQVLHRAYVPHLWVVIDESVLRRPIGSAEVMRAQVAHLIEICELPHVTIQILPLAAGGQAATGGPVSVLRLPGDLPDVVYLEQLTSAVYPDRPDDLKYYWHVMNRLVVKAERATATRAILHTILRET